MIFHRRFLLRRRQWVVGRFTCELKSPLVLPNVDQVVLRPPICDCVTSSEVTVKSNKTSLAIKDKDKDKDKNNLQLAMLRGQVCSSKGKRARNIGQEQINDTLVMMVLATLMPRTCMET